MNLNFFKDVDESSFWLTCWSLLAVSFTTVIIVVNYNIHLEDKIIAELIREGHDITELKCLYKSSENDMCRTLANTKFQATIMGSIENAKK